MSDRTSKVDTEVERIRVFLRGGLVAEGDAHKKRGSYHQRVSDMLNREQTNFLALTDVTYQGPHAPPTRTEAFLVHVDDVVAVDAAPGPRLPSTPAPPSPVED